MQFSGVVMSYPFDGVDAWRMMSFASDVSNFLIWDFSDFTNKHVAPVIDVNICAIFTDHCRIICIIMKPIFLSIAFIKIKYGSKNWQQWYWRLQVLFLILLSTSLLKKTFLSITSSIILARIPTSWTGIRIFWYTN